MEAIAAAINVLPDLLDEIERLRAVQADALVILDAVLAECRSHREMQASAIAEDLGRVRALLGGGDDGGA